MTMAAVNRASLKSIVGSASVKTDHQKSCASVARIPAATPLYTPALQLEVLVRAASNGRCEEVAKVNPTNGDPSCPRPKL
jgi:hypothetical protein